MSFRNRTLIANANGICTLSIPLEGGRDQKKPMREIRISNRQPWQKQHWRSLESAYSRSPWFEYYRDELSLLFQKPAAFLFDWNLDCLEWIKSQLGWRAEIGLTESYIQEYDPQYFLDARNRILPRNYQHEDAPKYRQVFEEKLGFLPNLSILDLLFCEGRNSLSLLEKME